VVGSDVDMLRWLLLWVYRIPPPRTVDLTARPAHDPVMELDVRPDTVLTGRRLGTILHQHRTVDTH
jgi:hypothetical protein